MSNLLFTIISDYLDELCQDIPIYICDVCKRELIYTPKDFLSQPTQYCGTKINRNIM